MGQGYGARVREEVYRLTSFPGLFFLFFVHLSYVR